VHPAVWQPVYGMGFPLCEMDGQIDEEDGQIRTHCSPESDHKKPSFSEGLVMKYPLVI
jgi:hypothetical protein